MGIPAEQIVKGAGGDYWRIYSNGQSQQITDPKVVRELNANPRGYGVQNLNYRYNPNGGQAIAPPGQSFSYFTRDGQYGTISGVTTTGQFVNLSGNQWEQLGRPRYTQYSFNPQQQSALALINQTLSDWGLSSLTGVVEGLIKKGDTNSDTLTLALSQTPEYKARFSGNAVRIKNGLAALTPAQYLSAEESYRQVLASYGLPPGFYDTQSALANFIGNDVSAAEVDARAKVAHDTYEAAPAYMKQLWSQYFGTKGDAVAAILDPKTATQVIQDRATQVQIGGAAAAQGLKVNQARAQQFQQAGVTQSDAQKAYAQIAQSMPIDANIAQRFGQTFGQTQEENDLLLNQGQAALQRQTLYNEEQGLFKGHAGADAQSIGVSQYR